MFDIISSHGPMLPIALTLIALETVGSATLAMVMFSVQKADASSMEPHPVIKLKRRTRWPKR